jgi:copper chaperone CopZ
MIKKTFLVSDMRCSNCAMTIESLEDELPGVKSVSASYHKGQVIVEFDEIKVSPQAIITAVREKGYIATLAG